ncbi:hypothetical protein GCM10023200_34720 [Actinomycetospora chlora]|uniref:Condensation protein n=1 Tax=Actinomycetospora chlora TaxID=663608 RepID=A0ABP9BKF7_9PSEU
MVDHHRWAPLPLPPHPTRADRLEYDGQASRARIAIRNIWMEFHTGLHTMTGPAAPVSILTWDPPLVGPITLGPPTRWSVELRPGQRAADFRALAGRLASAYEVDDVVVADLARGWISIWLVEHVGAETVPTPDVPARPAVEPTRPAPAPVGQPSARRTGRIRHHRLPLGSRWRRRPFGGPRTSR